MNSHLKAILSLFALGLAVVLIVSVAVLSVRSGWALGNQIYHLLFGR